MLHTATHLFLHINPLVVYLIVAVMLAMESSGLPVANNTLLILTGALSSLGHLNIWVLAVFAMGGSIGGACIAYGIGKRGGRELLLRIAGWLRIGADLMAIVERWFQRSGGWMIFFSRMIPYVRPYACFPAGISSMAWVRFLPAAVAGSLIWCSVLLGVGWLCGKRWETAVDIMQRYTLPALCVVTLVVVAYIVMMVSVKRSLRRRFHAAPKEANGNDNWPAEK